VSEGRAAGSCQVRLGAFQGPLDLLIHMVRTEEIDLADVPLVELARQYAAYLDRMEGLDLEAAGEALVLVAALVHMKSRRLLPPDPSLTEPAEGDEDLEVARLPGGGPGLREAAEHLQEREELMELLYARPPSTVAEYAGEQEIEADLFSLLRAFQAILKRLGSDPGARIARERMTLVERIRWLVETLQREGRVGFRSLFADVRNRMTCILTFLALLEVMRLRLARAYQSHREEDIVIVLGAEPPGPPVSPEETIHG
jgi:segregation and condensation protein A